MHYLANGAKEVKDWAAFSKKLRMFQKRLPEQLQLKPLHALAPRIATLKLWEKTRVKNELLAEIDTLIKARPSSMGMSFEERQQQEESERLTLRAEKVADLALLHQVLESACDAEDPDYIQSLRDDLSVKPLIALARQFAQFRAAFSEEEQRAALRKISDMHHEIPGDYQVNINDRWLTNLERLWDDVMAYEALCERPLNDIMQKYDAMNDESREHLENSYCRGPAVADMKDGASRDNALLKYGLANSESNTILQLASFLGSAGADVRDRKSIAATAQKYGIADEHLIHWLNLFSCMDLRERMYLPELQ